MTHRRLIAGLALASVLASSQAWAQAATATPTQTPAPTVTDTPTPTNTPTVTNTPTPTVHVGPRAQQIAQAATYKVRVTGTTDDTTVRESAGVLRTLIISNGDAAAQSLTLKDGSTTVQVVWVPTKASVSLDYNVFFSTSIVCDPSDADIDAVFNFD